MERRDFLRTACQACAGLAILPAVASMEGCAASKGASYAVQEGALRIPVNVLTPGVNVIRAKGLGDKVLINRRDDGTFTALVLNCPHKNGPVTFTDGVGLKCGWHGSTFDLEGQVTKGPSTSGLKRYPAAVEGTELVVRVG
jgi:nitrite reductase/ring-hydroxylating ferredoxin subunit